LPKRYPPLTPGNVIEILVNLGFVKVAQEGSHQKYRKTVDGISRSVTVDIKYPDYSVSLIKSMISQSGVSREEFYRATKQTGKKI